MDLPCHDRSPLSSPTWRRGWRVRARLFSVSEFAAAVNATPCSGSVGTAIGDSVIAARPVRPKPAVNSAVVPTVATNKAPKDEKTIAIGSVTIANAGRKKV